MHISMTRQGLTRSRLFVELVYKANILLKQSFIRTFLIGGFLTYLSQFENFKHLAFLYNCLNMTSVKGNPHWFIIIYRFLKKKCSILKTFRVMKSKFTSKVKKCVQCIFASTEDRTLFSFLRNL